MQLSSILFGLFMAAGADTHPGSPAVYVSTVVDMLPAESLVSIRGGSRQGLAVNDPVSVVDGARVVDTGQVMRVDAEQAMVRLGSSSVANQALAGKRAIVIPGSRLSEAKRRMPADTTPRGRVVVVGPASRQMWIDLGQASGLTADDNVWLLRDDYPIAQGRVARVLERSSLVLVRPLVSNTMSDIDDIVELWPSPAMRRTGRSESIIMAAKPNPDGAELTMAGSAREGFEPERQVELLNGAEYVGLAGITTASDRLCVAQSLRAFCTTQPTAGLHAKVRPPRKASDGRLEARLFDVRPGYVLISAGERDGVEIGQIFLVMREGKPVIRLLVKAVKEDFAGAEPMKETDEETSIEPIQWDRVVRDPVPADPVRVIGEVEAVARGGQWVTLSLAEAGRPSVGDVVRIRTQPPTAALITVIGVEQGVLYVPPGWGIATITAGTAVETVADE